MTYRTEAQAVARVFALARTLGVWPGYCRVTGGWALTYDPPLGSRGDYDGTVLL